MCCKLKHYSLLIGYDPYGYVQPMMANPLDHQVTLMQRLQAERRKRVFEYEMQKQREAGSTFMDSILKMNKTQSL